MADEKKLVMWEAHEYVGIAVSNVGRAVEIPITDEMWAEIEKKAKAAGMDPVKWFDQQVELFNSGWVLCPNCEMKGVPFPDEDPVVCGNCGHEFPRWDHLTMPPEGEDDEEDVPIRGGPTAKPDP
jgi:hypothetical protein